VALKVNSVEVTRWQNNQNPTESAISRLMKQEGLTPYEWRGTPNTRQAVRSHNYHRIIYVKAGTLEVVLPDLNQLPRLRVGDRIIIPAGVRHGLISGSTGTECLEAAIKRS
jgi:quercetin dioxygenase-like cupin family protein